MPSALLYWRIRLALSTTDSEKRSKMRPWKTERARFGGTFVGPPPHLEYEPVERAAGTAGGVWARTPPRGGSLRAGRRRCPGRPWPGPRRRGRSAPARAGAAGRRRSGAPSAAAASPGRAAGGARRRPSVPDPRPPAGRARGAGGGPRGGRAGLPAAPPGETTAGGRAADMKLQNGLQLSLVAREGHWYHHRKNAPPLQPPRHWCVAVAYLRSA